MIVRVVRHPFELFVLLVIQMIATPDLDSLAIVRILVYKFSFIVVAAAGGCVLVS